jgi:hypothetical protein
MYSSYIQCDVQGCTNTFDGLRGTGSGPYTKTWLISSDELERMMEDAKRAGWKISGALRIAHHLCPECSKTWRLVESTQSKDPNIG